MPNRYRPEDEDAIIFFLNLCGYIEVTQLIGYSFAFFRNLGCIIVLRSVFDLIPIIITILIFILITNQPAHNSQVDRPARVA